MSDAAHDRMWSHARGTLVDRELIREVGGILVGNLFRDGNGAFLEISGAIIAEHTRNEGTEVAFTPETWAQVNRVKDTDYPAERIVGWYHTHPNFGIFLSERDQFLHRHSFPQPWAVAHVIDPVQDLEGLFVWKAGEPKEAVEFWVGGDRRIRRTLSESRSAGSAGASAAESGSSTKASWLLPSGLALLLVLVIGVITFARDLERRQRDEVIVRAIESERVELDRAFQILRALRGELERVSKQSTTDIAEIKGQAQQLEGGLSKLSQLTRSLQRRIQGLEDKDPAAERGAQ
jgi:proteasome lid subunit RPN8/RPN11